MRPNNGLSPAVNDSRLVASLPPPVAHWLETNIDEHACFGDHGYKGTMLNGYTGKFGGDPELLGKAIALFDLSLVPVDRNALVIALIKVHRATKHRGESDADTDLWLAIFCDELSRYPTDVVDEACRRWIRRETWAPSVAELVAECDQLVRWRKITRAALAT